jgi:hypothetical protein
MSPKKVAAAFSQIKFYRVAREKAAICNPGLPYFSNQHPLPHLFIRKRKSGFIPKHFDNVSCQILQSRCAEAQAEILSCVDSDTSHALLHDE